MPDGPVARAAQAVDGPTEEAVEAAAVAGISALWSQHRIWPIRLTCPLNKGERFRVFDALLLITFDE